MAGGGGNPDDNYRTCWGSTHRLCPRGISFRTQGFNYSSGDTLKLGIDYKEPGMVLRYTELRGNIHHNWPVKDNGSPRNMK